MTSSRREWVGSELRRLRGPLTSADVQEAVAIKPTKLSRIEAGKVRVSSEDVRKLASYYGADAQTIERLAAITDNLHRPAWWTEFVGDDWDSALGYHLDLETAASRIESWTNDLVPGLLQVPSYVTALVTRRVDVPADQLSRRLDFRARRQERVRNGELKLWAILSEVVLYGEIGGRDVLREQLAYLADPPINVTVQIMPITAGAHSAKGSSFHVLHFPSWPTIIYAETTLKGIYDDSADTVEQHQCIFDDARAEAVSPNGTHDLLVQRLNELEG